MKEQERWAFRVPATKQGENFIKQFRKYLNSDSYSLVTRYTGPRPKGTPQAATLKRNATSIRVYVDSKRPHDDPSLLIERGREIEKSYSKRMRDSIREVLDASETNRRY